MHCFMDVVMATLCLRKIATFRINRNFNLFIAIGLHSCLLYLPFLFVKHSYFGSIQSIIVRDIYWMKEKLEKIVVLKKQKQEVLIKNAISRWCKVFESLWNKSELVFITTNNCWDYITKLKYILLNFFIYSIWKYLLFSLCFNQISNCNSDAFFIFW